MLYRSTCAVNLLLFLATFEYQDLEMLSGCSTHWPEHVFIHKKHIVLVG